MPSRAAASRFGRGSRSEAVGLPNYEKYFFEGEQQRYTVSRSFRVTLNELAERIRRLHAVSSTLLVPDLHDDLNCCLHATYLSFLPEDNFATPVKLNTDDRGWLFELIKSRNFGQIFVSKTLPGITRGNHYHDTKLEKFCVIEGQGVIRFRRVDTDQVIEYPVDDRQIKIVEIPPEYTHSIENTGDQEMICLFWANEVFDPGVRAEMQAAAQRRFSARVHMAGCHGREPLSYGPSPTACCSAAGENSVRFLPAGSARAAVPGIAAVSRPEDWRGNAWYLGLEAGLTSKSGNPETWTLQPLVGGAGCCSVR